MLLTSLKQIKKNQVDQLIGFASWSKYVLYLIKWRNAPVEKASWEKAGLLVGQYYEKRQLWKLGNQHYLFVLPKYKTACKKQIQLMNKIQQCKQWITFPNDMFKGREVQKILDEKTYFEKTFYRVKWIGRKTPQFISKQEFDHCFKKNPEFISLQPFRKQILLKYQQDGQEQQSS